LCIFSITTTAQKHQKKKEKETAIKAIQKCRVVALADLLLLALGDIA
jgi:hypothetical protein